MNDLLSDTISQVLSFELYCKPSTYGLLLHETYLDSLKESGSHPAILKYFRYILQRRQGNRFELAGY